MITILSIVGALLVGWVGLSYFTAKGVIEEQHPRVNNHGNNDN